MLFQLAGLTILLRQLAVLAIVITELLALLTEIATASTAN